jgi:DNA-binding beta-propeller fold protein YncE
MKRSLCLAAIFVSLYLYVGAAWSQSGTPRLKETIPLPGVEGRIDHLDFDAAGERLFVCALGNNSLEVVDLRQNKRVHSITGLGSPQGVVYLPGRNRIFVANDKGGVCKFYDGESYQPVGELSLGDDADNVRYDGKYILDAFFGVCQ